ncbi:uncharacterized protein LOC111597918 [Drosophila hydei]|uniref:Uncharacterized protein LOC111597918 n=1 Tax=Drosophila hydei TaxID=7224 RepID=A0A6J1LMH9_DROHY|nr:uncharacterized protein LOC111597918 [Drosophila hydei]XP_023168630.1 uncharacterized protein LOC111597918 [Drosophila hydei]
MAGNSKPTKLQSLCNTLNWFFNLPAVQNAKVSIVVLLDLLTLSSLCPAYSNYIARPFLLWKY